MMSIQAIVTAVQLKLPIIILVWEDDYYGLIKWKQEAAYHTFSHVELVNPELSSLATAFGCHGVRINAADEFTQAMQQAFNEKEKPTVIIIPVDYSENMQLTKRLGKILSR